MFAFPMPHVLAQIGHPTGNSSRVLRAKSLGSPLAPRAVARIKSTEHFRGCF